MDYKAWIEKRWDSDCLPLNWLELESALVAILKDGNLSDLAKVMLTKEAIDAFTRRWHFS